MAVERPPRAIWLAFGITMQHYSRHLTPVRAVRIRVQQTQVGDEVFVVVRRQDRIRRRGVSELTATGISLRELAEQIEAVVSGRIELVIKLYDTIAETLGNGLQEGMKTRFDENLAVSSLRFFNLRSVPAIRNALPPGVSDVHFRSDLSNLAEVASTDLIDAAPSIEDFLSS
jgi:hypothetical protein